MGRVREARAEGAACDTDIAQAMVENAPNRIGNPVPGDDGAALDRIVEYFRQEHPEAWEAHRLCPLQHGLIAMADLLRGRG